MGHHHISRSYFRQTDIKRSGNASIDIMSKFFKLMVVLQLMNDLNRSVQDAAISCIEAYSVLEVLRPLYNSPKILEQKILDDGSLRLCELISSVSVSLAPTTSQLLIAIRSQRCQILHSP
ncbi:uncharacterized protein [Zea mays]|uniref:uncharacterized protein isoform X2 n=1 Tax=Zea mays TaxID=4577 RepID=UPI0004DEAA8B|nr:uncharacterized protein LOC103638109 isoform X2 [Zea mays]|eukprot:XP_008659320.1 uncharacterized protein LOC103638109 isoform X2 [Zea mays]